jgi:alpha-L-fucosidase
MNNLKIPILLLATLLTAGGAEPLAPGRDPANPKEGKAGLFQPSWESLRTYECPEWFRDAKFGIWAHWGPQSVPGQGDWYARFLYGPHPSDTSSYRLDGAKKIYAYHLANYGHPSEFGYKDILPLFRAEKWEPDRLMQLYRDAGARYFVSMGQHHDNFDLWNSRHQPWNSVKIGPKRDIVREWQTAAKRHNMRFGVSFHGQTSWSWFEVSRLADSDGPKKGVPYDGNLTLADGKGKWWEGLDPRDLYCEPHPIGAERSEGFKTRFVRRMDDLIDSYRPDLIYFDGGVPFNNLEIASSFYNRSTAWHDGRNDAVLNVKGVGEENQRAVVLDYENNQSDILRTYPWQTDGSLDGWFFRKDYAHPATAKQVIQQLVDIISKNGNLLLNITQRSDGTIMPYAMKFLGEMKAWMAVNSEAVHGSRPWEVFGEGPTRVKKSRERSAQRLAYTGNDIRFTRKGGSLYVFLMAWPGSQVTIRSLPRGKELWFGRVEEVSLLGRTQPLNWTQTSEGLTVQLPENPPCNHVCTLKISGIPSRQRL